MSTIPDPAKEIYGEYTPNIKPTLIFIFENQLDDNSYGILPSEYQEVKSRLCPKDGTIFLMKKTGNNYVGVFGLLDAPLSYPVCLCGDIPPAAIIKSIPAKWNEPYSSIVEELNSTGIIMSFCYLHGLAMQIAYAIKK